MIGLGAKLTNRTAGFERFISPVLILIWLVVVIGLPAGIGIQLTAWLVFLAVIIMPGYLLGEMITWRLELDGVERLALAFPLGIVSMMPPGMVALLRHSTVQQLANGWIITSVVIIIGWAVHGRFWRIHHPGNKTNWSWFEWLWLLLLGIVFAALYPAFTAYRLDGDLYSFLAFVREGLNGRPMNVSEPLFGSGLGVGVRLAFNQYFPATVLRTYFAHVDIIDWSTAASRAMIALWVLFAAYMLGKSASNNRRLSGLFTVSVQLLIYMASPFFRGDNVSSFFFERVNTDKFLVTVIFLPVILALLFHYLRRGRRDAYLTAALSTLAVSVIHPMVAAALALVLAALGSTHLLMNLRQRTAWIRTAGLAILVVIVMVPPVIQLFMVRGESPMAPTYPSSFDGWAVGEKMSPAFPFVAVKSLDWYGPPPDVDQLEAETALTSQSPFLIWRFISNMRQNRLILFDLRQYVLDPSYILEPPFVLAFVLLLLLLPRLRSDVAVQYVVSTTAAVLLTLYNPLITPILGGITVPWLLWRFVWLLPYALIIDLAVEPLLGKIANRMARLSQLSGREQILARMMPLAFVLVVGGSLRPFIQSNLQSMQAATVQARYTSPPRQLMNYLEAATLDSDAVTVLAPQDLSIAIPAYAANANVIAHRALTNSEIFPADRQDEALQRLIDQNEFYAADFLTAVSLQILQTYDARYVITLSGTALDTQLRLLPDWFEWLLDDQERSLYAVRAIPALTPSIQGNTAMQAHEWEAAKGLYQTALRQNPSDPLALVGMAEYYRIQGQFEQALTMIRQAAELTDVAALQYQLGQLYAAVGDEGRGLIAFGLAQRGAPNVYGFHIAYGDACLSAGRIDCAARQFETAVSLHNAPDTATWHIALANLWTEQGQEDIANTLYTQALSLELSELDLYQLIGIYQYQADYETVDRLLAALKTRLPLATRPLLAAATAKAGQGDIEAAETMYQQVLWRQKLLVQDTTNTHVALAQLLLEDNRLDEAYQELEKTVMLQPNNAIAYILLGNIYSQQNQPRTAIAAYQKALEVDPTSATSYTSLNDQYRQEAESPAASLDLFVTATNTNPDTANLLLALGDQLLRQAEPDSAVVAYQLAINVLEPGISTPSNKQQDVERSLAQVYARLGHVYQDQGQIATSIGFYRAAVAADPAESWVRILLADMLRRQNQLAEAETLYQSAIIFNPAYVAAYLGLATLQNAQGDPQAALELYHQAIAAASSDPETRRAQAWALLALGRFYEQYLEPFLYIGSDEGSAELPIVVEATLSIPAEQVLDVYSEALEADSNVATIRALAGLYEQQDQPEQAVQVYVQNIAQGKEDNLPGFTLSRYYQGLGDVYFNQGAFDLAIEAYHQALALDGWSVKARVGWGRALSEKGDLAGARVQFEEAVQLAPGDVSAQLALANMLALQGDAAGALAIYQVVATDHPGNVTAVLALARAHQEQNQAQDAEQFYRQAVELAPGNADVYADYAQFLTGRARFIEAEAHLRQAIQNNQADSGAAIQLAQLLTRQGRYDEASAIYEQTLPLHPGEWRIYVGLGDIYHALGQTEQAAAVLRRAVALGPSTSASFLQLAALYQEQGQFDQAEQILLLALDLNPGDAAVRGDLADLYSSRGLEDEALLQLETAVIENPQSPDVLARYAHALDQQEQEQAAAALYQQIQNNENMNAADWRTVATIYQGQGDNSQALTAIEQAITLEPTDSANWLFQGQIQAELGETAVALDSLRTATQLSPAQGKTWTALGGQLITLGRFDEAVTALNQAIAVEPTYLPAYSALIEAYQSLQVDELAAATVRQAQAIAPGNYLADTYAARYWQQQLDWDAAYSALTDAVRKAPGLLDPYLDWGELAMRRGNYDEAIGIYLSAAQVAPGDWRIYTRLGSAYQALGEFEAAELALLQAQALSPNQPDVALQLSALYLEQNRPEEAESLLLAALDDEPSHLTLRSTLAQQYQSFGLGAEALLQLKLAVQENPDSVTALTSYAQQLRLLNDAGAADEIYGQLLDMGCDTAVDCRTLANIYQSQNRLRAAMALLEEALVLDSADATNWIVKGQLLAQSGDWETAVAALQTATELNPAQGQTWHAYGGVLLGAGQLDEAAVALQTAIAVDPTYLPAYGMLIQVYQQLGQNDLAEQLANQVVLVTPGSYLGRLFVSQFFIDERRLDEAREEIDQAVAVAPGAPSPLISLGHLTHLEGDADQALALYQQAIALRPGDRAAYSSVIELLLAQGRHQEALAQAEQALVYRPTDSAILLGKGQALLASGRYEEAEVALLAAGELDAVNGRIRAALAQLYQAQGTPQRAIGAYRAAIGLQPGEVSYYLALFQLLSLRGQVVEATAVLQDGLTAVAQPTTLYLALSNMYLQQGQPEQAQEILQTALDVASIEEPAIWQGLAAYHLSRFEVAEAERLYQQVVAMAPDDVGGLLALAGFYTRRGRLEEALVLYETVQQIDPDNTAVLLALADIATNDADLLTAAAYYAEALALNPTLEDAYLGLASVYQRQAEWDEAISVYEDGLAILPTSARLLTGFGTFLLNRGLVSEALTHFDQAVALAPGSESLVARSGVYRQLGRWSEALRDLETAVSLAPGDANAYAALAGYYQARGSAASARQMYQQVVAMAPGQAAGYLGLADLAFQQGQISTGWNYLYAARNAEPAAADPYVRMADAHGQLGQWQNAAADYRQAIAHSPQSLEAYLGLATITYRLTHDLNQSLSWLWQAQAVGNGRTAINRAAGDLLKEGRQSGRTAGYLLQAAELEPGSAAAYWSLSALYLQQGLAFTAQNYAAAAVAAAPRDPMSYITRGNVYASLGDNTQAEQDYRTAVSLDAARVDGHLALANFFMSLYRYDEAVLIYRQAAEVAPLNWSLWAALSSAYATKGDYEQAMAAIEQAMAINPNVPGPWLGQGDVFNQWGNVSEAVTAYEQAHEIAPDSAAPLLRLANFYWLQGDFEQAETIARQAITLEPLNAAAHESLARALGSQGLYVDAIASYEQVMRLDPRQLGAYDDWVNLQRNVRLRPTLLDNPEMADALIRIANGPEADQLWAQTALAIGWWQDAGPTDEALTAMTQALAIDPVFAGLYERRALLHEDRLDGRLATDDWNRFIYALRPQGDTLTARAHVDWLGRVMITSPVENGRVSGLFDVMGTAVADDFQFYKIELSPADGMDEWFNVIEPVYQPVEDGLLATISTAYISPGRYRLRLTVVNSVGNLEPRDEIQIFIDG